MKIKGIDVYAYDLTYAHGEYVMSGGRAAQAQSSTLVRVQTDAGVTGWGEACPLGGTYLPAFPAGIRASLQEMLPYLIGEDPTRITALHEIMDGVLLGQEAAKSPIDIACWDILGKVAGLPVAALIGGRTQESFPLYEAVPLTSPEEMAAFCLLRREAGISRFQLKVGNDPHEDAARTRAVVEAMGGEAFIVADSNGGWNLRQAVVAVRELAGLDVIVEQPCRDLADCALVQQMSTLPLSLDECVTGVNELYRAKFEAGAVALNIKIGRLGGISGAVRIRDLATELGMIFTIEDVWGGDVTSAAVAQVAGSARPDSLMHASFFNDWTNEHVAGYAPRSVQGRGRVPDGPGLGIEVDEAALGAPIFSVR
ncbi:L-alanine-DL-glutamate epimerase-like enolase superfamily enzyme [Amaricoccus macauensis]|uniref:L-alanine-DL-glutamate epimerase-like enolase superfamily enzyme n=1 Tax=Amaricoccus macauensis TaxID=57001 RepID=A0A840SIA2_9RHOB|nr:mandelate racemase/muconate lactonizing enzyme family protein [Amaricoccus macauensis]MBB5222759.1 L-alanine-DL-glutamate epimerase-like enolase superfamily enzyme [Amaricoccus macauensis]